MNEDNLISAVESILFSADRPIHLEKIREVFGEEGPSPEEIKAQIENLKTRYQDSRFGFELREAQGGYQFTTKVENAEYVRKFLQMKPFRVGRSALETLAIIAYRQPVTRAEIDQIRGIDSSHLLRVLMERGLVKMDGKAEVPGRPVQYGTTPKFLETVGLSSLGELPPLSELDQLQGDTEDPIKTLQAGLDRFMEESPVYEESEGSITEGLDAIDTLIQTADRGGKDVYESPEAAAVAAENEEAVKAFQESSRKKRRFPKKTVKFEELTASANATPPTEENVGELPSDTASVHIATTETLPETSDVGEEIDAAAMGLGDPSTFEPEISQ